MRKKIKKTKTKQIQPKTTTTKKRIVSNNNSEKLLNYIWTIFQFY